MGQALFGVDGRRNWAIEMSCFVHLNVHSDYSRGWGVASIEDLCRRAKALQMDRLALTDTNGVYGLVFFVQTAKEMGITPIVGSELLGDGRRAVLLVKNLEGYANLCHIISARQCHGDFDLVRAILKRRGGLIIFSDDFTLLKALKHDSIENLFVEMSPGYQMSRCHAIPRKSGIPPPGHQPCVHGGKKPVSASPDSEGHVVEHQIVQAGGNGSVPGLQFFKCPTRDDGSVSPRAGGCL